MYFIILFLNCIFVPLRLSFDLEEDNNYQTLIDIITCQITLIMIIIDIIYSLNSAYYSKGVFVKERMKIIKNYFKYNFLLDFLVWVPIIISEFTFSQHFFWRLNFFLIFIKLKILIKKIEDYLQFKDKHQGFLNLMKLIFQILYNAHLCGCGWNYMAKFEINYLKSENTWMHHIGIQNEDWITKYVNSLYFSIVTMATVGYGDTIPNNTLEKSFAIISIVLTCGFFAYAINSVGIILKEMNRVDDEFKYFNKNISYGF